MTKKWHASRSSHYGNPFGISSWGNQSKAGDRSLKSYELTLGHSPFSSQRLLLGWTPWEVARWSDRTVLQYSLWKRTHFTRRWTARIQNRSCEIHYKLPWMGLLCFRVNEFWWIAIYRMASIDILLVFAIFTTVRSIGERKTASPSISIQYEL